MDKMFFITEKLVAGYIFFLNGCIQKNHTILNSQLFCTDIKRHFKLAITTPTNLHMGQ